MLFKFKGEIGLTFDYTNDYFNPTKGFRVMPTVGIGTNFNVKSDNSDNSNNEDGLIYTYSEATVNIYVPLFWTLYGALSGSVGGFFSKAIEDDARKVDPALDAVIDSAVFLQAIQPKIQSPLKTKVVKIPRLPETTSIPL